MTGILNLDKPAGWTSHDAVAKLRRILGERRIGHGGTLDPMATGVLPIFLGRATRAVPFFEHADKVYEAVLRLGLVTDTQDPTGRVLEEHPVDITQSQLEAVLSRFRGPIQQIPPMYSAVKVNGQKLYALARKGQEVEREARTVVIHELTLLDRDNSQFSILNSQFALRVHCSKGTYVRTLCHDIGAALGCGGCMAGLRRTRAGRYGIEQAHSLEEILADPNPERFLLPVDSLFADRPRCAINEAGEKKLRNGASLRTGKLADGEYRVYGPGGDFLALCAVNHGEMYTVKSFFEPL